MKIISSFSSLRECWPSVTRTQCIVFQHKEKADDIFLQLLLLLLRPSKLSPDPIGDVLSQLPVLQGGQIGPTSWIYKLSGFCCPVSNSSFNNAGRICPLDSTSEALFSVSSTCFQQEDLCAPVLLCSVCQMLSWGRPWLTSTGSPLPPCHVTPWPFVSKSAVCLQLRSLRRGLGGCLQLHLQGHH